MIFSDILKDVDGISAEWVSNGRFCIPRLIFYFERAPSIQPPNKKLEHNMEDRIYHVLKKTRIISSTRYKFVSHKTIYLNVKIAVTPSSLYL